MGLMRQWTLFDIPLKTNKETLLSTESIKELKELLESAYDLADEIMTGDDCKQGRIHHIEDTVSYAGDAVTALEKYEKEIVK